MPKRAIVPSFAILAVCSLTALTALAKPVEVGKNAGETKGRWLRVQDVEALKGYETVALGEIATDIVWKKAEKESPIDEDILRDKIRQHVLTNLRESGLFAEVLAEAPASGGEGVLRIDCDLQVDPGNRAARYVVGFGAGKSQSVLELFLRDHASDQQLGLYHGFGTGSGMGLKLGGGGARKMTQDDIQENAKRFVELLQQVW